MKASNVDQALTSPVALRKNREGLAAVAGVPIVVSAICFLLSSSSVDQLVALDPFFGVELVDGPLALPFLVLPAWVDRQRLADLHRAFALMDVAVQGDERLPAFDRLTHGGRADGPQRAPAVQQLQVRVDRGCLIQTRLVRRAVQVEDRARRIRAR